MYLDKDKILNSLTKEDVIKIVVSLGSEYPKEDHDGNLIFQTVCHNIPSTDNSWKLYYYPPDEPGRYGLFHCYTGCSESFDIIELVIRAKRKQGKSFTWYKALNYVGTLSGKLEEKKFKSTGQVVDSIQDLQWMQHIRNLQNKRITKAPTLTEINPNILEVFSYIPHEAWLNDHITREALNRFEIGYYGLTDQITIPHRDKDGRLIGIRGRFLDKKDASEFGKYVPLQIEGEFLRHSLGSNLYGLNVVKNKVERIHKIMLVEGEKSCLQAYSYFGDDSFVVAVCGSNITATQTKLLMALDIEEIIVGFDREYHEADSYEAGVWWNRMMRKVEPLLAFCKVSICADRKDRLDFKDSPFDKGKDVLLELLDEKITVTLEDVKNAKR